MHEYEKEYIAGEHRIIECKSCGYKHIYPYPCEQVLDEFYRNYHNPFIKHDHKDKIYNVTSIFDGKIEGKRVLDVGCGDGGMLKQFKDKGFEVMGIEPSSAGDAAVEMGIPVIKDVFANMDFNKTGGFDVVILAHILEHIPDPYGISKKIYEQVLNDSGVLCIDVPNDFNEFQMSIVEASQRPMWWVSYPDHINYFTFTSMQSMLEKIGFKIIIKETDFPMELFLMMGEDYTINRELGSVCHKKRVRFEEMLEDSGRDEVKHRFYGALAASGLGRNIKLYVQK